MDSYFELHIEIVVNADLNTLGDNYGRRGYTIQDMINMNDNWEKEIRDSERFIKGIVGDVNSPSNPKRRFE